MIRKGVVCFGKQPNGLLLVCVKKYGTDNDLAFFFCFETMCCVTRLLVVFVGLDVQQVRSQFQIEPGNTGLFQATVNYFHINGQASEAYYDSKATSLQSSNLLVDLVLAPKDADMTDYVATKGDKLGVSIRLKACAAVNGDRVEIEPRELLHNPDVLRASEVVMAVPDVASSKMSHVSIWPDLTSSWRFAKSPEGWRLSRIRWRFLMKKVFPEAADLVAKLVPRRAPGLS
mmetsp:Transcript_40997/g.78285  ORF Transcript_40997/g.78285 Transcript_40997/m.78285 type:complete len:230 (-) Transcript_40997:227-916(-)